VLLTPASGREAAPDEASVYRGSESGVHLAGTQKQLKSWNSSVTTYGHYWRSCVFLHAYPSGQDGFNLTSLREFFIRDVLVHEIGHHVDQRRYSTTKERESFADAFAIEHDRRTEQGRTRRRS